MEEFKESGSKREPAAENEMPNLMPGLSQEMMRKREQTQESWTNLIVFLSVLLVVGPVLFFGPKIFRTPSDENFLLGLPLTDFGSLQPVVGEAFPPKSVEFANKTFFIILWGPWDDASCELLQKLAEPLGKAERNPDFQVIPIAYFAKTSVPVDWYSMDANERAQFLNQKRVEQSRLDHFVEQTFMTKGFRFPNVWWDPVDRFRLDLMDLARAESSEMRHRVDGIGFPTIIHAEHGVIRHVWTCDTAQDLDEMKETLTILAAETKKAASKNE